MLVIRPARPEDADQIWTILEPILRAGETYCLPRNITREEALSYWFAKGNETFVASADTRIVGTYFLRANQGGGGAHVANCGYLTASDCTGRGIAGAMCRHSLDLARRRGFAAMQFNFVVSANERAVRLWQNLGFAVVGCLPGAFLHPQLGSVDAYVMFRSLA